MTSAPVAPATLSWRWVFLDIALVWLVFVLHGSWPVPDGNETHYLSKARHFWEPQWIARDLVLSAADGRVVFYSTLGWLAHVLPMPAAAWAGRLITWAIAAWGWRRLSFAIVPRWGWAALAAAGALALNQYGSLAGEWFVGGFEAKGIAYALVFFGFADVLLGRWNRGLVALGAASAFHVLVGGWSTVAAAIAWLLDGRDRPRPRTLLPGLVVGGLLALGGILPGIVLSRGVDARTAGEADRFYVMERAPAHLYPPMFPAHHRWRHAVLYAVLIGIWTAGRPADRPRRRLRHLTLGAAGIALCGWAIAYATAVPTAWEMALLKFYWFRLSDVLLPAALALEACALAASSAREPLRRPALAGLVLVALAHGSVLAYQRETTPVGRGDEFLDATNIASWRDVGAWIREHTPNDSLVLAPRSFQTFMWYAERAEFAVWKDDPVDARSLVEWKRRIDALYDPGDSTFDTYPPQRLIDVSRRFGVDYIVTFATPAIDLPPVYRNRHFVVYALPR